MPYPVPAPPTLRACCPRIPGSLALRLLTLGLLVLGPLGFGACGGGGGGGGVEAAPAPPASGLRGTVSLPGLDLGRIAEQEPNDTPAQPYLLPAVFPRCALEIAGLASANAVDLGGVDPMDIYRFASVADQEVTLSLTYRGFGGALPDLDVTVIESASRAPVVASMGGALPRTARFAATAGVGYDLEVRIVGGSAAYVLRIALEDPVGQIKPLAAPPPARVVRHAPDARGDAHSKPMASADPPCACDRLLVRLESGVDVDTFCGTHGLRPLHRLASGTWCLGFAHDAADAGRHKAVSLSASLSNAAEVRYAEPDWMVASLSIPNDPLYAAQWNLHAIGCEAAWDITTGSANIVIGLVDSGIIPSHPDLADRIDAGYDFISDPSVSGDGDGRDPDPTDAGDRFLGSGFSSWHGTHVAGICVGKQNDGFGITGVAPGCRVMSLRALGVGGGFVSDVADAILFGAGLFDAPGRGPLPLPLRIMNLSIGLSIDSSELRLACDRAFNRGVFLVGATGNTGQAVLFPARYESVFAVAAVDARLLATAYSNFGPEVDLAAPGGLAARDLWARGWPDHILSTVRDETRFPSTLHHGGLVGTSHAVPHVAGAAALLLSIDPTLTSTDLRTLLKNSALDIGAVGWDVAHGAGLLQVHRAVKDVLVRLGQPRSGPPILVMPTHSLEFVGFDTRHSIPISNGGGGLLSVTAAQPLTDDGSLWLSASFSPGAAGDDTTVRALDVTVDRNGLAAGQYSGTLRLANPGGVLTAIRVVMYVGRLPRVGRPLHVAAIEEATGIARRSTGVYPEQGWRFWLTDMPESFYKLKAGEDLDQDGFFCEPADFCAWWGGPTEAEATPVLVRGDEPAVEGLDVELLPPPGG